MRNTELIIIFFIFIFKNISCFAHLSINDSLEFLNSNKASNERNGDVKKTSKDSKEVKQLQIFDRLEWLENQLKNTLTHDEKEKIKKEITLLLDSIAKSSQLLDSNKTFKDASNVNTNTFQVSKDGYMAMTPDSEMELKLQNKYRFDRLRYQMKNTSNALEKGKIKNEIKLLMDSLSKKLDTAAQNTYRVDLLNAQADIYKEIMPLLTNEYSIQAITLASKLEYADGIKDSRFLINVALTNALKFQKKLLENERQLMEKQRIIRNLLISGFFIVIIFVVVLLIQRRKTLKEKKISENLLLNILPSETANELRATGKTKARSFDEVTVMFTDFKNFTKVTEKMSPEELINEINYCYSEFDKIITEHSIEKIKTIGDSYMCAAGLPVENATNSIDTVKAALQILQVMDKYNEKRRNENRPCLEIRIGIHTGPVVAGIVGIKKFAYDIWGDTVNIASRIESVGEAGKVNISANTYLLVKDFYNCIHRGKIEVKNKGLIDMYFILSEKVSPA